VNPFRVSPTIKNGAYPNLLADNLVIDGKGKLGGKHAVVTEHDIMDAGKKTQ